MKQRYSTRILSCLAVLLISSTSVFAQDATTPAQAATDPNAAASCCCANMKNMDMGKTGTPSKCMTPAKTLMDQGAMKGMNHAGMDHSQMQHAPVTPSGAVASPITEHGGH